MPPVVSVPVQVVMGMRVVEGGLGVVEHVPSPVAPRSSRAFLFQVEDSLVIDDEWAVDAHTSAAGVGDHPGQGKGFSL